MEKEWMDRLETEITGLREDVTAIKVEVGTLKYAINRKNLLLSALTGLAVAIAATLLGSCGGSPRPVRYLNEDIRSQYASAAAVEVECLYPKLPVNAPPIDILAAPFMGLHAGGSAFAVGPAYAMTARHVVDCERTLPGGTYQKGTPFEIILTLHGGAMLEFVVVEAGKDESDDAALLVAVKGSAPFHRWASLAESTPPIGAEVCLMAAYPFEARTCGPLTNYRSSMGEWMGDGYITYGLQSIPGNSGSAVYDESGAVIAINVAGTLSLGGGYLVEKWAHMVPPVWADLEF